MRNGDPANGMGVEYKELQMLTGTGELQSFASGKSFKSNGDPANGMGTEVKEMQMLTGSGELMQYSMADGTGSEPLSYEVLSYAGGKRRLPTRRKPAKGGLLADFRKNQKVRQQQRTADSKNNAAAIAAMKKEGSKPALKLPPLPKEKATGLSMGAKIGIGAGIALLLGTVAYFVITRKK